MTPEQQGNGQAAGSGGGGKPNRRRPFRNRRRGDRRPNGGEGAPAEGGAPTAAPAQPQGGEAGSGEPRRREDRRPRNENRGGEGRGENRSSENRGQNTGVGGGRASNAGELDKAQQERRERRRKRRMRAKQGRAEGRPEPSVIDDLKDLPPPPPMFIYTHVIRPSTVGSYEFRADHFARTTRHLEDFNIDLSALARIQSDTTDRADRSIWQILADAESADLAAEEAGALDEPSAPDAPTDEETAV